MINYCHACAIRLGLVQPIDVTVQNLTGSNYQFEKFMKHTAPLKYAGIVSVFFWQDYPLYRNFTISGSISGILQIDDQNRKNWIYYAGRDIGITYEDGKYKLPNDAVKVVLSDNPTGIHAFPVSFELQYVERCPECNRVLPT
jgi:hypothetical protein